MATFGNLETEVEPLAGLIRDHIEVHGLVTELPQLVERVSCAPKACTYARSASGS